MLDRAKLLKSLNVVPPVSRGQVNPTIQFVDLLMAGLVGAFTDLSDVPHSYTGETGKVVAVNGSEDGLDFIAITAGDVSKSGTPSAAQIASWVDASHIQGIPATTASIAPSTNRNYVTDAQATVIGNTSGTNTGDQDLSGLTPKTRSLTINGNTQDLSADRTWTVASGLTAPVTENDYGSSFTIPDTGGLSQPTQLTLSGSEQLIIAGTGQIIIFDPTNFSNLKGEYNPPSIILRQGEFRQQLSQIILNGNESITLTEDACLFIRNEPQIVTDTWDWLVKMPIDFTTSSLTFVNIPGLSSPLLQAGLYEIKGMLLGQSSSVAGVQFNIVFSSSGATGSYMAFSPAASNSSSGNVGVIGTGTGTSVWLTATTDLHTFIRGMVKVGTNPGSISVQIEKITSGSATVYAGCAISGRKLN